ncbi:hypothetical protein TA3x_001229 [Tundrisphaera sp. TA3]|uniref:hypothetical protein n=1 Tax=Tundrisphaera sp. TA3 TaxID=3435775 RepID=UPI003EBEE1E0
MSIADPPTALNANVRAIIDARLDTLDRMLLGRVGRADRIAIGREVESQIHDLLAEQARDEPTRDDILAVLSRIDPPEAYLPEDGEDVNAQVAIRPGRPALGHPIPTRSDQNARLGRVGAVLGLVALGLMLLSGLLLGVAFVADSELAFVFSLGLSAIGMITGTIGFVIAATARLSSQASIIGFVTGLVAALASILLLTIPWLFFF